MAGTNHIEGGTITGTIGGTLLAVVINISTQDISETIVLGTIGACVSFIVSMTLKHLLRKFLGCIQKKN
jgi:hypothetical protein